MATYIAYNIFMRIKLFPRFIAPLKTANGGNWQDRWNKRNWTTLRALQEGNTMALLITKKPHNLEHPDTLLGK
ncbi:hypothetical protein NBRC116587_36060 [Pseudoteredinibacter isoporae]